jgi:hypothetical protein
MSDMKNSFDCNHNDDGSEKVLKKLPQELALKIEEYFEFHWENNPLSAF